MTRAADLEQKVLKLINNWLNKNKFLVKILYFRKGSKPKKRETSLLSTEMCTAQHMDTSILPIYTIALV